MSVYGREGVQEKRPPILLFPFLLPFSSSSSREKEVRKTPQRSSCSPSSRYSTSPLHDDRNHGEASNPTRQRQSSCSSLSFSLSPFFSNAGLTRPSSLHGSRTPPALQPAGTARPCRAPSCRFGRTGGRRRRTSGRDPRLLALEGLVSGDSVREKGARRDKG